MQAITSMSTLENGEPHEVQKNCFTLVGFETTATELRNQMGDSRCSAHHIVHIVEKCETNRDYTKSAYNIDILDNVWSMLIHVICKFHSDTKLLVKIRSYG